MTVARIMLNQHPLAAFQANMAAHEAYPLDSVVRMQTLLSLGRVQDMGARVVLSHDAADRIYEIAASAQPHHALVRLLRVEYLLGAVRNANEVDGHMNYFAHHMTQQPAAMAAVKAWRNDSE